MPVFYYFYIFLLVTIYSCIMPFPQFSPKTKIPFSALPPPLRELLFAAGTLFDELHRFTPPLSGTYAWRSECCSKHHFPARRGNSNVDAPTQAPQARGAAPCAALLAWRERHPTSLLNRPSPPGMAILSIRLPFVSDQPARSRAGSFLLFNSGGLCPLRFPNSRGVPLREHGAHILSYKK